VLGRPAGGARGALEIEHVHSWRLSLACLLLALELAGVIRARFVDTRWFCWAPHNQITEYTIAATVGGRPLSDAEVLARYRLPARGLDDRSYHNVLEIVRLAEERYHPGDNVQVTVTCRVNGHPPFTWRYPP